MQQYPLIHESSKDLTITERELSILTKTNKRHHAVSADSDTNPRTFTLEIKSTEVLTKGMRMPTTCTRLLVFVTYSGHIFTLKDKLATVRDFQI